MLSLHAASQDVHIRDNNAAIKIETLLKRLSKRAPYGRI